MGLCLYMSFFDGYCLTFLAQTLIFILKVCLLQDLCEDALDGGPGAGSGSGHRHSLWSRDNLHATSYRDMREIIAMPPQQTSGSRDNTLSRDMHLINVRHLLSVELI